MDEIFEIIKAFNRLEDKVNTLNAKIDMLLKSPFKNVTLNGNDVARLLGVHPNTLYNLRREGKIPFLQIRRRIMYSASDLLKYLRNNTGKNAPHVAEIDTDYTKNYHRRSEGLRAS